MYHDVKICETDALTVYVDKDRVTATWNVANNLAGVIIANLDAKLDMETTAHAVQDSAKAEYVIERT